MVALTLLAWGLALRPALDNRFHADEALYGYWGLLIGRGRDPWLVGVPVYKPPLLPYLVAGAQALFGSGSEFIVRLPGLAAGLLMIPLVAALARSLYRERWTAVMAAIAVALSPFAILFSATIFTDPVMVTLGLAACVAAARKRPRWAGLLAGLSFATKQPGLAWLPLVFAIQLTTRRDHSARNSQFAIRNSKLAIRNSQFAICTIALTFAWDAVRVAQGGQSFWGLGVSGYGGLRLIWPQELWLRLRAWLGLARYFFVSPVVNGALIAGLPALVWHDVTRRRHTRASLLDLSLVSFVLIYFLLHWLCAFPVWDRYLLPLLPILSILLARILTRLASKSLFIANYLTEIYLKPVRQRVIGTRTNTGCAHGFFLIRVFPCSSVSKILSHLSRILTFKGSLLIVLCSLLILLILPAWNAAHSRYPVGGDHWAYDGLDDAAAFLSDLPEGTVLYQHWLGWHYTYYLFDAPVYLAYWPTPAWLAQDVQAFGDREARYITFPSWESSARVERALADVGYELEPALTTTRRDGSHSFTIYRVRLLQSLRLNQSGDQ